MANSIDGLQHSAIAACATLAPRADWQMPPKPHEGICPGCGEPIIAEAYIFDDGDEGWMLAWSCGAEDARCNIEILGVDGGSAIAWPFEDDSMVTKRDLEAIGFEVTEDWF